MPSRAYGLHGIILETALKRPLARFHLVPPCRGTGTPAPSRTARARGDRGGYARRNPPRLPLARFGPTVAGKQPEPLSRNFRKGGTMNRRAFALDATARWVTVAATIGALALAGPAAPPAVAQATAVAPRLETGADHFFTRKDVRLRYRDIGRGPPVVLLHGYTQRIELMEDLADSLADTHRVIG